MGAGDSLCDGGEGRIGFAIEPIAVVEYLDLVGPAIPLTDEMGAGRKRTLRERRKLAKSKPSKTTFRPTPVSCGITERSLFCSIKSSLMRDFRVRSPLPVARPAADLSQPCAPPVSLSLATPQPRGRKPALRREIPSILRGFQGRLSC